MLAFEPSEKPISYDLLNRLGPLNVMTSIEIKSEIYTKRNAPRGVEHSVVISIVCCGVFAKGCEEALVLLCASFSP